MTYYIQDLVEGDEPISTKDLMETMNVEEEDIEEPDSMDLVTDLFMALMTLDEMMGDDPVKFDGMKRLVRVLATADAINGRETEFEVKRTEKGEQIHTTRYEAE